MHDHDLDLIAAYAQGDHDERAARLVQTCRECRAEYEQQQAVRSWLSAAAPIRLDRSERRRLHTAVAAAVATETSVVPPFASRRTIPWWSRAAAVAAALLLVVAGAGAIRSILGGGGQSADLRDVGAGLQSEEGLATTTTAAAETTMAAAAEMARAPLAQGDLGKISRGELESRLDALLEEAEKAEAYGGPADEAENKTLVCSDTLEGVVLRALTAEVEERAAELYVYVDRGGELHAVALEAETCGSLLP